MTALFVLGIPFLLSILLFLFNINTFEIKPKILVCNELLICFVPFVNFLWEICVTIARCCNSEPNRIAEYINCEIKDTKLNRWFFDNFDDRDWPIRLDDND